jgi:hypothetical protein
MVQVVILPPVFQIVKALFDCAFLHAGNPKAGKGLFAARHMVDETENQFALAPRVGGAHKAFNVLAVHKLP